MADAVETEAIAFVRKSARISKTAHFASLLRVYAIAILCMFIAGIIYRLYMWIGAHWTVPMVTCFVLAMFGLIHLHFGRRARLHLSRELSDSPPESESSPRLTCVGHPDLLRKHGELADHPFEPEIFISTFGQPFSRNMMIAACIVVLPAFFLGLYIFSFVLDWSKQPWSEGLIFKVWFAVIIAAYAAGWLWPTYLRIVPGRLDVMRFSNLSDRPVSIERIPLSQSRIVVDLRRGAVFIDEAPGKTHEISILLMKDRERFTHRLFLAAISTHQPPPLPDDALLG